MSRPAGGLLCLLAVAAGGLGACGNEPAKPVEGGVLRIYSGLPMTGPDAQRGRDVSDAARLALRQAGNRVGKYRIDYRPLDDATADEGNWDPKQTSDNARDVADDDRAIAYLGDLDSGATGLSLPILNDAHIPQVTPTSTYTGLTRFERGAERGEPEKYYPQKERTLVRLAPRDRVLAEALLDRLEEDGCKRVAIASDRETGGAGLAALVEHIVEDAKDAKEPRKLEVIGVKTVASDEDDYEGYAKGLRDDRPDCLLYSGLVDNGAARLYRDFEATFPGARIYGAEGTCSKAVLDTDGAGIPESLAERFACVSTAGETREYPGGPKFLAAFRRAYGRAPDPRAIWGYEAMRLVIDGIREAGARGNDREAVRRAILGTKDRRSPLGTYSVDRFGDASFTEAAVWTVQRGRLAVDEVVAEPEPSVTVIPDADG